MNWFSNKKESQAKSAPAQPSYQQRMVELLETSIRGQDEIIRGQRELIECTKAQTEFFKTVSDVLPKMADLLNKIVGNDGEIKLHFSTLMKITKVKTLLDQVGKEFKKLRSSSPKVIKG